jgi:toxin YoeB
MILSWVEMAREDYLYWQETDKKLVKRINTLISDILFFYIIYGIK